MFSAALMSRSLSDHLCSDPHALQRHCLIPRPAPSFGLLMGITPQHEQVWVKNASFTSAKAIPVWAHLYSNIVLMLPQPASKTDLAMVVLTIARGFTLLTKIAALVFTSVRVNLWMLSLRRFAILACIALTQRVFSPAVQCPAAVAACGIRHCWDFHHLIKCRSFCILSLYRLIRYRLKV